MSERLCARRSGVYCAAAMALGLAIAWADLLAPFGDDSEKATLLLWLVTCGVLGMVQPRHAWRWGLLVGPWVTLLHAGRLALALSDSMNPPTYTTALLLLPVSLVVCLVGAYGGVLIGRAARTAAAAQEP